jgi:hypothetical protein
VSALSWSWRALRAHSITSAGLFASALLGLSIVSGFRHLLTRLGAPWYVWLIAPILVFGYLGKKEEQWFPEPAIRRRWARRVLFGSIAIAVLLAWLRPSKPASTLPVEPAPVVR